MALASLSVTTRHVAGDMRAATCRVSGSTSSHANAPMPHKHAATTNEAVHPYCAAIHGVSDAVSAPPACAPMFINPENDPENEPPISALTDQKELCDRY